MSPESSTDTAPDHAHGKTIDKLIYMANQIGTFFKSQGADAAVTGTAEHIRKFWDPRMRAAIFAHLDAGGAGLDDNVKKALQSLPRTAAKP